MLSWIFDNRQGRLVGVVGRHLGVVLHLLRSKGFVRLRRGVVLSFGQSMALHPIVDMLKRNFRIEESDAEGTIARVIDTRIVTCNSCGANLLRQV